jgi:histidinol dehydrogenase
MLEILEYPGEGEARVERIASRVLGGSSETLARVAEIVDDVRERGDAALLEYTRELDRVPLAADAIRLEPGRAKEIGARVDGELAEALRGAIASVRAFHERQVERSWEVEVDDGVVLGQRVTPLESVGLYVPGGRAAYPSSLIMNAVPAIVAGVERIVAVTPPATFHENPTIAFVLSELGVEEVYTIGGAQAIAALAYGTETVSRVDKIVGPGNLYVALAKKLVYGAVGIDSIAGPSEIVVLADRTADAGFVAADLLSQAEHDEEASAILVTTDGALGREVAREVESQLAVLARREIARASLERYGAVFVVDSLERGCELVNRLAPEHLELMVEDPERAAARVRHAGAIFFGPYSTEAVGDYYAGPNHVLPTGGTARFMSPLGVYDFVKRSSIVKYTRARLEKTGPAIAAIARAEGLTAHERAITIRLDGANGASKA